MKGLPQFFFSMGPNKKFQSGTWNGVRFSGFSVLAHTVFQPIIVFNENESFYMFEHYVNSMVTRITLNHSGLEQRLTLKNGSSTDWSIMYSLPYQQCDSYGFCGANGICRTSGDPICNCLEGFIPKSQKEWEVLNWSNGCVRKMPLDCQRGEGFVKVSGVKLPDLLEFKLNKSMSLEKCKEECLKNCSCTAHSNLGITTETSGCFMWFGDLVDCQLQK